MRMVVGAFMLDLNRLELRHQPLRSSVPECPCECCRRSSMAHLRDYPAICVPCKRRSL